MMRALLQSHSDGESQRSNMEREDTRSSPSTPSTPSVCSPTSTTSSVPSTGKNMCASCGLEILDRYLLKVRGRTQRPTKDQAEISPQLAACLFTLFLTLGAIWSDCKTRRGELRREPGSIPVLAWFEQACCVFTLIYSAGEKTWIPLKSHCWTVRISETAKLKRREIPQTYQYL